MAGMLNIPAHNVLERVKQRQRGQHRAERQSLVLIFMRSPRDQIVVGRRALERDGHAGGKAHDALSRTRDRAGVHAVLIRAVAFAHAHRTVLHSDGERVAAALIRAAS